MEPLSYPGVYINEASSGVRTITAVSTSIAAFLGRTAKGKLNKAERLLSPADFDRKFGAPHPKSDLAYNVRQFFDNGGTDCYVVRLADGAVAASLQLTDLNANNILLLSARTEGTWGNNVRIEIDYNTTSPDESFNMSVIQEEGGNEVSRETHIGLVLDPDSPRFAPDFVTQSSEITDLTLHPDAQPGGAMDIANNANSVAGYSQSRVFDSADAAFRDDMETLITTRPNFFISIDDTGYQPVSLSNVFGTGAGQIDPDTPWAVSGPDSLETAITTSLNAQLTDASIVCSIQEDTSGQFIALRISASTPRSTSVRIRRAGTDDLAGPMMLGLDQGGIEVTRHQQFRPVPTGSYYQNIDQIIELAALDNSSISSISIDGAPVINFDFTDIVLAAGNPWFEDSSGDGDGIREKLRRIVETVNNDANSEWRASLWGYHLAFSAGNGSINRVASAIASLGDSHLGGANFTSNVLQYTLGNAGVSNFQNGPGQTGLDGNVPQVSDFIGNEAQQTGFHALDSADLINLMVIPDDAEITDADYLNIWGPASTYCAGRRAFLLVDSPSNWTASNGRPAVTGNTTLINDLRVSMVKDHSAVFYPRIKYLRNGLIKTTGAGGALAGLMARTDATRGVWKAPAGIEAGIRNIVGLNVELTDRENGVLNKKGTNCIRIFPNGIVNWGARTLDGDDDFGSEWKYIPIRRLALMIEESLFRGTKWVVFEPNDEPLWAKIRLNMGAFMMSLFRQGAFQGSDPKQAYFVNCDKNTTTQNDIDRGIVNIQVGFAPLKPAEFVVITVQQIAGQIQT